MTSIQTVRCLENDEMKTQHAIGLAHFPMPMLIHVN